MNAAVPFLAHDRAGAVVAWGADGAIDAGRFLREVRALAALLPDRPSLANLCRDRYRFAVGFGAALLRGQLTLLPPDETSGLLERLAADFPGLYCLTDGGPPRAAGVAAFAYPGGLMDGPAAPPPAIPAAQPAAVLFTSGSTGEPRPHARSWGNLVRSARAAGSRLGVADLPGAAVVGTVPHQHSYGLESTVLLALQNGLALGAGRPFYPADVRASLAAAPRPRILVTTPIHLRAVLAEAGDPPSADLLISATAPLARSLAVAAEAGFRAPLREIYGCSEAGQLATRRTALDEEWQCLPGVELRQDAQGTWAAGPMVAGPTLLPDAIELRSAGRFLLSGRTADLVNIAGKRTSLAYLDHQLNAVEGVCDGVFVMPRNEGEGVTRLIAFAVAPGLAPAAILAALRQRIDAAFLPRPLLLVEALPRTVVGKLPRAALLKLAVERGAA